MENERIQLRDDIAIGVIRGGLALGVIFAVLAAAAWLVIRLSML